ncbi:hypothetical protein AMJ80_05465 [bacterium SM23_31]|nr:MAG: hypothetical protein AMJ80_05465 [bacterium SM23_31]
MSMKEILEYLASLQEVDKKLFYLEFSKGDLPKTVSRLKSSISKLETQIKNTLKEIEKIERERISIENLVELAQEKLKKYQNQLYNVTSNKEYDAITNEIEMKKKEIEEGENQILEMIQANEENQNMVKEYSEEKEQLIKDLKSKEKELNALLKATEKEELELNHMREKLTVRLKLQILKRYERIRNAKSGVAVVPITRDACGGCFKTIPPQKIVEVEKLQELIQCDVCGRILIPENKLNPVLL